MARFVGDLYSHVCVPNHWVEWNSNLVISSQNCAMCIKYYCINVVQGSVIDKVDIFVINKILLYIAYWDPFPDFVIYVEEILGNDYKSDQLLL